MLPHNAENGNFGKLTYAPSVFKESNMYLSTQPLEKRVKGFGSHDASRRDEFTSSVRTEQYRQSIRKETQILPHTELLPEDELDRAQSAPPAMLLSASGTLRRETLYDIGRSKVTEFDPKSTKDRFYKSGGKDRQLGLYQPSSTVIGQSAWNTEYKPPSHGAASLVKVCLSPPLCSTRLSHLPPLPPSELFRQFPHQSGLLRIRMACVTISPPLHPLCPASQAKCGPAMMDGVWTELC
jgi:hypothetical protein